MATAAQSTRLPSGRSFLEHVQKKGRKLPSRVVLQGVPGIGKTSWAAHAPGVLFGMPNVETGLITLLDNELLTDIPYLPVWNSWDDVLGSIDELTEAEHDYKTFVIDGLGGVESFCHQHVCRRDYKNQMNNSGFLSYNKGFETSLTDWGVFLAKLDKLREEKRMSIILLAHTKVALFRNPEAEDFDRYAVDVHAKTWSITSKWADMVLFANYVIETVEDGARRKGRGGHERVMYTDYSPAYDAKNRHNLPDEIDMGDSGAEAWNNFMEALKAGRKQS